jgi:hypothetical protein
MVGGAPGLPPGRSRLQAKLPAGLDKRGAGCGLYRWLGCPMGAQVVGCLLVAEGVQGTNAGYIAGDRLLILRCHGVQGGGLALAGCLRGGSWGSGRGGGGR